MACGSLQEGFKVDTLANAGNKQPFNSEGWNDYGIKEKWRVGSRWIIIMSSFDNIWVVPKIGIPPNHPFLIGFSIINHPFWGETPYFRKHPYMLMTIHLRRKSGPSLRRSLVAKPKAWETRKRTWIQMSGRIKEPKKMMGWVGDFHSLQTKYLKFSLYNEIVIVFSKGDLLDFSVLCDFVQPVKCWNSGVVTNIPYAL